MGAYTPEGEEWLSQAVEYVDGTTSFVTDYVNSKLPGVRTHSRRARISCGSTSPSSPEKIGTAKMAADYNRTKAADARCSRRSRCSSATS